jgi:ketosteroid isomerase-like protein
MEISAIPAVDAVVQFLECINRHDADKLAELMSEDHVFVDSLGASVAGREHMRTGWRSYFALCPDYWVSHDEILTSAARVAVFGTAGGTIAAGSTSAGSTLPAENKWRTPTAWLAIVDGGLVKQWRVYADNKPVYDILARSKPSAG